MTPLRIILVSGVLLLAGCSIFHGSETGFGGVTGVIVDHSHTGVRGANVSVMTSGPTPQLLGSGRTDARGQFSIDKVPAGRNLTVGVSKTFNVRSMSGQKAGVRVGGGHVTDVGEIEIGAN